MATLTKVEIAASVLEALGVKAAGQSASSEDEEAAENAVSSAYYRLRYESKAPYDIDSVPEWAWTPLRDYVARDLINNFGISGERLQGILAAAARADRDIAVQTAGQHDPRIATAPLYY